MEIPAHTTVTDPLLEVLVGGRYRIEGRLARGSLATVYRARDERLGRPVALKLIHAEPTPGLVDRLTAEAQTIARLAHPNVVTVYDQGHHDGLPYLVMEFVRGKTLRVILSERGRLSAEETLVVLEQMLAALTAAHRAGLVHRDVKPENILIAPAPNGSGDLIDAVVKVADFGLARAVEVAGRPGERLLATAEYVAPELVADGRADARADIYAVGVVAFEMLTGVVPFDGANADEIAWRHVDEDVPAPSSLVDGVPGDLDDLVVRTTSRLVTERPMDADTMLAEVRAAHRELLRAPQTGQWTGSLAPSARPEPAGAPPGLPFIPQAPTFAPQVAPFVPEAPAFAPQAPAFPPQAPAFAPQAPAFAPQAPAFAPQPPAFAPQAPMAWPEPAVQRSPTSRSHQIGGFEEAPTVPVPAALQDRIMAGTRPATVPGSAPPDDRPTVITDHQRSTRIARQHDDRPPWARLPSVRQPLGERLLEQAPLWRLRLKSLWQQADDRLALMRQSADGRRRLTSALALIMVLLLVLGYWVLFGRYTPAPNLVDLTRDQAVAAASKGGFGVAYGAGRYSETIPKDTVVAQDPPSGERIVKGGTLTLILSLGPERYEIPDMSGQAADFAATRLKEHFQVTLVNGYSDTLPVNYVVGTDPPAGTPTRPNAVVKLIVAKGPYPVHVPNVVGMTLSSASDKLTSKGYTVEVEHRDDTSHPRDQVIEQTPAGGSGGTSAKGVTVHLVVANGPAGLPMPTLAGIDCSAATKQLETAGLVVTVNGNIVEKQFGKVVGQDPAPDTRVKPGDGVSITCGLF